MNDSLKDWIGAIIIVPIILAVYLYLDNPNFASYINKSIDKPPYVSLRQDSLIFENFDLKVGFEGFNIASGDYDGLNKKIYDILKGKSGVYHLIYAFESVDQYGNSTPETYSYGVIDADNINKFQTVDFWLKSGGIGKNISDNTKQVFIDDLTLSTKAQDTETNFDVEHYPLKIVSVRCTHSPDCADLVGQTLTVVEQDNQISIDLGGEISTIPKIADNAYGYETTESKNNHTYIFGYSVKVLKKDNTIISVDYKLNVTYDNGVTEVRSFVAK